MHACYKIIDLENVVPARMRNEIKVTTERLHIALINLVVN